MKLTTASYLSCKIYLFFLATMAVQCINAQSDSTTRAVQIIQLEQQLNDSLPGGKALWSKHLDPHWYMVDEDGRGSDKNEFLATLHSFPVGVSGSIKVTHPVFSFQGNTAVIHYVADEHEMFLAITCTLLMVL